MMFVCVLCAIYASCAMYWGNMSLFPMFRTLGCWWIVGSVSICFLFFFFFFFLEERENYTGACLHTLYYAHIHIQRGVPPIHCIHCIFCIYCIQHIPPNYIGCRVEVGRSHWRGAPWAPVRSLQNLTPSWWMAEWVGPRWVGRSWPSPKTKHQTPICYAISWEVGGGCPKVPAPPPTSTGGRWLGGVGRLEIGGARLLFALHPPPSIWGGGRGVGGSEPASGEGASPRGRSRSEADGSPFPQGPGFAL